LEELKLAEIAHSEAQATILLKRILPYSPTSKAYASLEFQRVEELSDDRFLARCTYTLNKGYENKVKKPATGAYTSPLENSLAERSF